MGGGRDFAGNAIYRRRNGVYERLDGKPVNHRLIANTIIDAMVIPETDVQHTKLLSLLENRVLSKFEHPTPTDKVELTPLPQTGRQVSPFLEMALSIADLNDSNNAPNNKISRSKRKLDNLVAKIMNGDITTENGGFVFNEHVKSINFMKYNNLPSFKDVLNQIRPQIRAENLREIIPSSISSVIDGKQETSNLFVFEVNVTDNNGNTIKTYAKFHPFHAPDGNPYMALVNIHRPIRGRIIDRTTAAQKG